MSGTPTPGRLYVHDDLTEEVRERHGAGSPESALAQSLLALVGRDTARVTVLTVREQIAGAWSRAAPTRRSPSPSGSAEPASGSPVRSTRRPAGSP